MKKSTSNANSSHRMPGRGTIKSMASLIAQKPKLTSKRDTENLLTTRREFSNELKQEQEHFEKVLGSSSYLSECMKNIFTLPHEKALAEKKSEMAAKGGLKFKQVNLHTKDINKLAKEKVTFMTDLQRKDQVIELFVPEEKEEVDPEELLKPKEDPATIDAILEDLESTQKQLKEDNDDLAELRRRVEMTEKNMYLHMHSVGNIRHCLENFHGSSRKPEVTIKGLKKAAKRTPSMKNIDKIRAEVDKELGIKPTQKVTLTGKAKTTGFQKGPATKHGIMNSLINITGRMAEFSNIIGQTLKTSGNRQVLLKKHPY